ncbi:MAG TPA: T9SS type A sorting domain-containing protein [Candidatus Kapabacteria bacterium]|nr:T9SS type A sorting domain-containing protein [Candidatus Kapabacteria bacterium]
MEFSRIQIFDLLGRMHDEIPIEPQTTSIEYASNRLAPGMYIATLDGNAIKFIVP